MNSNILSDVKLIKRHSAAGVIIGILGILSLAIPVIFVILPWLSINVSGEEPYISGLRMVSGVDLIKNLFKLRSTSITAILANGYAISYLRESPLSYYLTIENMYAAAVWYILSILFAFIVFLQSLVFLIRGKLNHPRAIVTMMFFSFLSNAFLMGDSLRVGFYFHFAMGKAEEVSGVAAAKVAFMFWPAIIATSVAFGVYFLCLLIYLIGIRNRYYKEDLIFVDVDPEPFEKNSGVQRNTLPNSVTTIGGHEYAKNTVLEIANIPQGIKELGNGAFSNCINLKVVSIPTSVKAIGMNCFFNCGKLRRINYGGSKLEWRKIARGSNWLERAGTTTVLCKDGPIAVNPKH